MHTTSQCSNIRERRYGTILLDTMMKDEETPVCLGRMGDSVLLHCQACRTHMTRTKSVLTEHSIRMQRQVYLELR